jgi:hypothetical protein
MHAVCEYTKLHEICTLKGRHKATVVPAITRLINKIEQVYGYCRMWEHSVDMKKEAEGCSIEGAT